MSSDHYHTYKDALCWDCNNLIKNIYENAIVWGEILRPLARAYVSNIFHLCLVHGQFPDNKSDELLKMLKLERCKKCHQPS